MRFSDMCRLITSLIFKELLMKKATWNFSLAGDACTAMEMLRLSLALTLLNHQ